MFDELFSDFKKLGRAFIIIGVLDVIAAVITAINGLRGVFVHNDIALASATAVFLVGVMYFFFGHLLYKGKIGTETDILAYIVQILGIAFIITGIVIGIDTAMDKMGYGAAILAVGVIAGAIVIFLGRMINDGKVTPGDKVVYFLLLIASIVFIMISIVAIMVAASKIAIGSVISSICDIVIACFILKLLFEEGVKKDMGIV